MTEISDDSIVNLIAGLNTTKDKKYHSEFVQRSVDKTELESMYRNDWISGKVVDIPVQDATRKWRRIVSESLSQEQLDKVLRSEKKLGFRTAVTEALRWARLYGGAGVVLGIDDGADLDQPLDVETVKQDSLKYLHVFNRYELVVDRVNTTDPYSETFRKPETFRLPGAQQPIHASRVLIFDGRPLPWQVRSRNGYWGESYLAHVYDAIMNAQGTIAAVSSLPYKAVVDVIAVQNFFGTIAAGGKSVEDLTKRFQAADQIKSINNALVIDKDREELSQQVIQFGGLSEIVQRFVTIVASASDIPATRFLGESAPGLNSAGQMEIRNHYDSISAYQETGIKPQLDKFDEIHARSVLGFIPDDWDSHFESLWQPNELEKAQAQLIKAQRDQIYLNGVIMSSQVAEQLKLDGTYETLTDDYIETMMEIDKEDMESEPEEQPQPEEEEEKPEEEEEKSEEEEEKPEKEEEEEKPEKKEEKQPKKVKK